MQSVHARILPELSIESGPPGLRVLEYALDEALSEPSSLVCVFDAGDAILPRPAELLDKRATFVLRRTEDEQERTFTGVVVACELGPASDDVPAMRIEVAPCPWDLGRRADCRIFSKLSAVDIVKKVLEGAGVAPERQDWHLGEEHPTRVYTVQYRETDLAFVQRLLAEEGIYWSVVCRDGKDVIVLGDAPDGFGEVEGATKLPFHEVFGGAGAADRVYALERTVSVQTDKVFVRDYDPDRPKLEIESANESVDPGAHVLEVYDYPARALEVAAAAHRAKVLLQSVQAERDVVRGEVGSLTLVPGWRVTVEDHPYDPLNQAYLVIRSRITGSQPRHFERGGAGGGARASQQKVEFWGVPTKTTAYRPPRRARAQTVPGLQTAITTGPPGEEIHTDAGGHVTVLFHWDRLGKPDDTSSRWIRTSQLPLGGSMLLPRVGWGSTNELRMGDSKGGEEIFFNASKDMTTQVKNNLTETIANDKKKKVGSNQKKNVTDSVTSVVGANQKVKVGGNQSIKTETFLVDEVKGNHTLTIGGSRDMKVGGDHKRDVGGASTAKVDGRQVDLVVGSITHETLASFKHDVGAALVQLSVGNRTVTVGGARSESAGGAKIIAVKGGRGVDVAGSLNLKVGGAIVNIAKADRVEGAGGTFTEIAAGAQLVKANNVVFEAQNMLSVVMGASTVTLMPAMVAIAGLSVKLDGDVVDEAALIVDN